MRQLDKYGDDPTFKAIVLRIDSPGGGIASSQEIYMTIGRLREEGKRVVVSLGSLAASSPGLGPSLAASVSCAACQR
jgi:protease-4